MSVYCRRSVRFGRSRRRSIGFNMPHATPTASAAYSRERPEVRIGHWPPVGSDAVVVGVIAVAALYVGRMISCRWLWPFCSALCFRRSDRVEAAPVASRPRVVGHTCSGPRRHLRRRQDHRQPVGTSRREPSALPEHDPRIDQSVQGAAASVGIDYAVTSLAQAVDRVVTEAKVGVETAAGARKPSPPMADRLSA